MASITFDIQKTINEIKKLSSNISNLSSFFNDIGAREEGATKLRFLDQKDPQGNMWRDPITLRRNAGGSQFSPEHAWRYWKKSNFHAIPKGWHFFNRGMGDKTLIDTSNLRSSIQYTHGKNFVDIGTNVKYGKYVQKKGFQFLGISEKTKQNIDDAFKFYMEKVIK